MAKAKGATEAQDDFWNDENQPKSNWFSFAKVGARVRGIVMDIFDKPSNRAGFPDQRIFVLRVEESSEGHEADTLCNVPIKKTSDYLMGRTYGVKKGDRLGFVYTKDIPPSTKGFNPAKSIQVYHVKDADKEIVAQRQSDEEASHTMNSM